MKTISIYNHKGGTGKTALTASIAAELALNNKKVLMIDSDIQGNLSTQFCGKNIKNDLADVLFNTAKLTETIKNVGYENLFILPTKTLTAGGKLESWIKGQASDTLNRNAIKKLIKNLQLLEFDFVLWDFAPAYTDLTKLILLASDEVIPVLRLDAFSVDGLGIFYKLLEQLKDGDEFPYFSRMIFNSRDKRRKMHNEIIEQTAKDEIKKYIIPIDPAFDQSQKDGQFVQSYELKKETMQTLEEIAKDLINTEEV